jgi:hypothetical protein
MDRRRMDNGPTTRIRIWLGLAVIALVAGAVAFAQRPATEPEVGPSPKPHVLYGAVRADGSVCTEGAASTTRWRCLSWVASASGHDRIVELRPYRGTCARVVADQERGRWRCHTAHPHAAGPHTAELPPAPSAAA